MTSPSTVSFKSVGARAADLLASPAGAGLAWTLHGLLFLLVMPLFSPSIAHVDADSADVFQRSLALAYQTKNPPLYEWLTFGAQALFGPGPRSFLLVRYGLMGLIGVAVYALVLDLSRARLQAAAASYGLMSFYWFAWYFHDAISHSILVALACVVFLHLAIRWLRRPSLGLAVLIGLAAAFGLLSKLNFAILIAGVVATLAADRTFRPRLLDGRLLLSLGLALVLVAPVLHAASSLAEPVATAVYGHMVDPRGHWLWSRLSGGAKLVVNYGLFLLPWGLVALAAFRWRAPAAAVPPADGEGERFLLRLAVTTAVLVLLVTVAIGARSVSERYLFPVLIAFPVWVHVAWGRRTSQARQFRIFGMTALAVLALVLAVRTVNTATATLADRDNKRYAPFDRLAGALEDRGLGQAFFVTPDRFEAGNLVAFLPSARAAGLDTQRRRTPMSYGVGDRCALLFRAPSETGAPAADPPLPNVLQPLTPPGAEVEIVRVPWHETPVGPPRTAVFGLVDLGRDAAACRSVFGPAG